MAAPASPAARPDDRGRAADSPSRIPPLGWKDILLRTKDEIGADRIGLIAAGCAFYLLLALFPALAALVSVYGLLASPSDVAGQVEALASLVPAGGLDIITEQLNSLATTRASSLSFGLVFGLLFSLWNANNGLKTMFEAMNVAYDETEKRGFFRLNLLTLAFTLGGLVFLIVAIAVMGAVPALLDRVGLGSMTESLIAIARWPILFLVAAVAFSLLYRYGPSRHLAKWRWVTWGSAIAAIVWIVASALFGWYLASFANYEATYGSLGAAIGFLMWIWLSIFVILAGAELDAEIEHQTARDSTVGPEKPLGQRGATMADTVGKPMG